MLLFSRIYICKKKVSHTLTASYIIYLIKIKAKHKLTTSNNTLKSM